MAEPDPLTIKTEEVESQEPLPVLHGFTPENEVVTREDIFERLPRSGFKYRILLIRVLKSAFPDGEIPCDFQELHTALGIDRGGFLSSPGDLTKSELMAYMQDPLTKHLLKSHLISGSSVIGIEIVMFPDDGESFQNHVANRRCAAIMSGVIEHVD